MQVILDLPAVIYCFGDEHVLRQGRDKVLILGIVILLVQNIYLKYIVSRQL